MKSKLFAWLLAVCLIFTMIPGVMAEEAGALEVEIESGEPEAVADELGDDFLLLDAEGVVLDGISEVEAVVDEPVSDDAMNTFANDEPTQPEGEPLYPLTVTYIGPTLYKVYDKTANLQDSNRKWLLTDKDGNTHTLSASDFSANPVEGHRNITLTPSTVTTFSGVDAGSYKLAITVRVAGEDVNYYFSEGADPTITVEIPAEITKRQVTVTPKAGLTKVYGTADPSGLGLNCTVPGLLALTEKEKAAGKSLFTGKMGRQEGENVGKYQYTLGTLDFGNDNYEVSMTTEYFEITAKDINSTNVGLVTIGNQKYTGKPITPEITLRYTTDITTKLNATTLKQGTDFTATFSNNTEPGTAKVVLTGKGNYTGTRETSFNILKVTDDTSGGSEGSSGSGEGSSGGGSYYSTIKAPKLCSLNSGKKKITLKWKKVSGVTGYEIQWSTKKRFSSYQGILIKGNKTTKYTIKGLKSRKTYYVRIRSYKKIHGEKIYSPWTETWSTPLSVKTK